MAFQLDISALDLVKWGDQIESKSKFPELVRRLISATAGYLLQIDFPSGDTTYEGGWDGIVTDASGSTFVPAGQSGWELGTSKNKKKKAEDDYAERTNNPLSLNPADTTFVLTTPRNWSANAKRDWIAEKEAENIWKQVRLLDAKDLEVWLSTAPAVQYWFSRLLNKRPADVADLESYWLDWSVETTPATPTTLLTLGRHNVVKEIHNWLKGSENTIGLRADSRSEALAMFAAVILALPESEQITYLARCVVVLNVEAWRELVASHSALLLVPLFEDRTVISGALRKGHRVIVPLDQADINWHSKAFEIPRLPRSEVSELLYGLGQSRERADELSGIARRSFAAFRRALTEHPTVAEPVWVRTEYQDILVAALLVGAWDEQKEMDRAMVAQVAATDYVQVKTQLISWLAVPDPPVRLVGSTWFIIDKADVWSLIAQRITAEHLERFTQVVMGVLGSIPPRFDLAPEDWYQASMLGKESPYSGTLRESLATTLAFLGPLEAPLPIAGEAASEIAARIVSRLLRAANADWRIWSALSHNLRWLAEAAPTSFWQAVQEGLRGDSPVIMKLFEERKDILSVSSEHSGLLWALETLAWSPRYLTPVALILAKLSRLDPGGSLLNRPINSLREIFLPWHPQTAASLERRLRALDEMQLREPAVASALLAMLGPKAHSISQGTNKPRWRDWLPSSNVTRREVYEATLEIQARLLRDARQDVARWEAIIEDLPELPYEQQDVVIAHLRELSKELTVDADLTRLRDKLRELISQHRSFYDADWAMLPAVVDRLAEIMDLFAPANIIDKHAWLFDTWPKLPEGREGDSHAYEAMITEQQSQALIFLYSRGGLATILSFIPHVKSAWVLGRVLVLADVILEAQALELVGTYLKSDNEAESFFGLGVAGTLVANRLEEEQLDWAEATLVIHKADWSAMQQAEWLHMLRPSPQVWQAVSELAPEGQAYYWQILNHFAVDGKDVEQAARFFLQHNQLAKAVDLLGLSNHRDQQPLPTDLATEALERVLYEQPKVRPASHNIEFILEELAEASDADRVRVIRLEFSFLSASFSYRAGKRAKLIYQELNANPALFVELVTRVFRAKGEERRVLTPEESNMNIASWHLLDSWRIIPGTNKDGSIDQQYLFAWVTQARELLQANDRQKIGDEQLGQLLSESSLGADEAWPHEAVRALLERLASPDIERGFMVGQYNSRGTTVRGPYDGGEQERMLAKKYFSYAETVEFDSPRTAEILRKIAQGYERDAQREDNEASLNQDLP
jgi:hypothetical protein